MLPVSDQMLSVSCSQQNVNVTIGKMNKKRCASSANKAENITTCKEEEKRTGLFFFWLTTLADEQARFRHLFCPTSVLIFSPSLFAVLCNIYIPTGERDLGVRPPLTKQSGKNGSEMADYCRRGAGRRTAAKWALSALK